jgi:hypothetical protein
MCDQVAEDRPVERLVLSLLMLLAAASGNPQLGWPEVYRRRGGSHEGRARRGLGGFTPVMLAWLLVLAVLAASCAASQQGEIDASPPTQDAPQPPRSDPPSGAEHATQTDAEQVALAGTDTQGRVCGPVTVDAGGTVEFEAVRVVVPPGAVSTDGLLRVGAAEQIELGDWMDWAVPPVEVSLEGTELTGTAILEVSLDAV